MSQPRFAVTPDIAEGLDDVARTTYECAETIRRCARSADTTTSRALLNDLAAAVAGDHRGLLGVDLVAAYPPEVLLPDPTVPRRFGRLARLLAVLRDVSVFAPVAVTWWYLWKALSAKSTPGESFLDGWRSGFDGQVTPLGNSAMFVALLVGGIAVLTFTVHLLDLADAAPSSLAQARAELGGALARATLVLAREGGDGADNAVPMADVRRLVGQLSTSTSTLVQELRRVGTSISDTLNSGPTGKLAGALDEWSSAAKGLNEVTRTLTAPSDLLERFLKAREEVTTQERELRVALQNLVAQIQQATQATGAQAQTHQLVAERIMDLTTEFGETVRDFGDQTHNLLVTTERVYDILRQLAFGDRPVVGQSNGQPPNDPRDGRPTGYGYSYDDGYEPAFDRGGLG